MSHKTRRVGAFASAVMLLGIIFAAHGSGAYAQSGSDGTEISLNFAALPLSSVATPPSREDGTSDQPTIRFVANEVVQELLAPVEVLNTADHATLHQLVAATSAEGELAPDLKCLAQAIYFESRGEPIAGQLAVARVIINRSASSLFPNDYCSVVTQRSQFSFVRNGRIPAANERSAAWTRAVRVARIAHQDLWQSEAGDALYFHANYVRPRWANTKTARATIDSHIFYR